MIYAKLFCGVFQVEIIEVICFGCFVENLYFLRLPQNCIFSEKREYGKKITNFLGNFYIWCLSFLVLKNCILLQKINLAIFLVLKSAFDYQTGI